MTDKIPFIPNVDGYTINGGTETDRVEVEGGGPRSRLDLDEAAPIVTVSWLLSSEDYEILEAFYYDEAAGGATIVLCDLAIDDGGVSEHEVTFVPGTFKQSGISGLTVVVTADLEVLPLVPNLEQDDAIVALYEAGGEESDELLNLLEQLVNFDWPDAVS